MQWHREDVLINEEEDADDAANDFVICSVCGAISTEAATKFKPLCEHSETYHHTATSLTKPPFCT